MSTRHRSSIAERGGMTRWEILQQALIAVAALSGAAVAVVWLWSRVGEELRLLIPRLGG